jgi:putative DNA primase/helicase
LSAGSAWGGGGIRGYIRQWRATDNGLEGIAALHNDAFLPLDELSQIDAKSAANVAYMLANGSGKGRAGRGGEARRAQSWRVLFLSTGEIGLADKIAEDHGRRTTAGQQVRVLDVPADAGAGMGIFEDLHGFATAQALVNHLRRAAGSYYGVAIRPYLKIVAKTAETVVDDARLSIKEFADQVCDNESSGQVRRAAERFGLIAFAGELAVRTGILPWPEGEATDAAQVSFKAWIRDRGGDGPAEVNAAIQQIRFFIERFGSARFEPTVQTEHDRIIPDRAGYRRDDGWLVLPEVWKRDLLAGFSVGSINRALIERKLLIPGSDGRAAALIKIRGVGLRLYHLNAAILDGTAEKPEGAAA